MATAKKAAKKAAKKTAPAKAAPKKKPVSKRITLKDDEIVISKARLQALEKELQEREETIRDLEKRCGDMLDKQQEAMAGKEVACPTPDVTIQDVIVQINRHSVTMQNVIIHRVLVYYRNMRTQQIKAIKEKEHEVESHLSHVRHNLDDAKELSDGFDNAVNGSTAKLS